MPQRAPEDQRRSRAHHAEAVSRTKAAGASGAKSNLAGQIIPIYGFAILLYILYILFKITSKGKTTQPAESRFTANRSQNTQRKITDFELAQLQDRLNETKDVIERIISSATVGTNSGPAVCVDEHQLLHQLQEITRVMQEGRLVDSIPANPSGQQWDDADPSCCAHSPDTHTSDPLSQSQPETGAQTGSDITAESESSGGVRRRTQQ
ncbi:protein RIC-3b isoform X2 [Pseudorasbora parva]